MKNRPAIGRALIGLFLVAAAFGRIRAAESPRSGDPALDRAIAQANSEWAAAMKTGDVAAIVKPYLPDALFVAADGTCLRGRTEIESFYRERFRKNGLASATRIEPRHIVRDGELAFESGYGEVTATKEGKPVTSGGRYLTVWQRQRDESWKILRNVVLP